MTDRTDLGLARSTTMFLLGLLALFVFAPLLYSGYTTTDDIYNASGIHEGWRSPWIFDARRSGRLQHVFAGQLMPLAYGWGIYWVGKVVALTSVALNVVALFFMVRTVAGSSRFAVLAVVFFFGFIQNTWDHNLLTAYPFIFHFALTCFFLSVTTWWMALTADADVRGAKRLTILSVALFAVGLLTYENFLTYVVVFPVLAIAATGGTWGARLRRAARGPHVPALVVFVALLVLFRVFFYTDEGRQFNAMQQYEVNLGPGAVVKVLERYGASAVPLHYFRIYRDLVADFYLGYGTPRGRILGVFKVFDVTWAAKAVIVAFLVASLTLIRSRVQRRGPLLVLALTLLIATNLPLAVTAKYQTWVVVNFSRGYLTAYFAFFGVVILLALIIDGLVGLAAPRSRMLGRVVTGVFAVAALVVSYGTDFVNAHISVTQRRMFDRSAAVDAWVATPEFKALPEGSLVLAPSLWTKLYEGETQVYEEFWSRHVMDVSGRFTPFDNKGGPAPEPLIQIVNSTATFRELARQPEHSGKTYYLKVMQSRRDDATYLVFAHVTPGDEGAPLRATVANVLAHARNDRFRAFGRLFGVDPQCRARVLVDGVPSSGTATGLFAAHIDRPRQGQSWLWSRLEVVGGSIDPASVMLSESSEEIDGDVTIVFQRGFYDDELVRRWAEDHATVMLHNRGDRPLTVDLHYELHIPSARPGQTFPVEVTAGDVHEQEAIGNDFEKHAIRVAIPPRGSAPVTFATTAPRTVARGDPRNLVMMFATPLRTEEVTCTPAAAPAVSDAARAPAASRAAGG